MSTEIREKLDQLANYHAQKDVLNMQKQALIDQVLTPEIKARLAEIEAEFSDKAEAVEANISILEEELKQEVLHHGSTVKGTFFQAIWNKGRVSWDTKGMDDFAKDHPEVLAYRKQGEPYISFRKI